MTLSHTIPPGSILYGLSHPADSSLYMTLIGWHESHARHDEVRTDYSVECLINQVYTTQSAKCILAPPMHSLAKSNNP